MWGSIFLVLVLVLGQALVGTQMGRLQRVGEGMLLAQEAIDS